MKKSFYQKLTFWNSLAAVLIILGIYSVYIRFSTGLGASTNLTDEVPWGLWITFKFCIIGLAAGGFTICAFVYIFNIKDFKPILRSAILTAFICYLLFIISLLIDLGRPDRIWHALIMWNPSSVMFEVAVCVVLYTTVLALEFSPLVFERFGLKTPLTIIKSIIIPLVITGVILSTLHQSSLGSLFLIVPDKLYSLWYSELLPIFFFVSAITVGLSTIIIQSFLSNKIFNKKIEFSLLIKLANIILVLLIINLAMKIYDLINRNAIELLILNRNETYYYWSELLLGFILPLLLLSVKKIRMNKFGLFISASFVIIGFILNRFNISISGLETNQSFAYYPSFHEIIITAAFISAGFVAFTVVVKYFPVFVESTNILDMNKK